MLNNLDTLALPLIRQTVRLSTVSRCRLHLITRQDAMNASRLVGAASHAELITQHLTAQSFRAAVSGLLSLSLSLSLSRQPPLCQRLQRISL